MPTQAKADTVGFSPGIGILNSNPLKITGGDTGGMSLVGHMDFYGYIKTRFGSLESLAFVPMLGVTTWFLTGKTADPGSDVLRYHLGASLEKSLSGGQILHFGPGIYWHRIQGDGRVVTLSNGGGTQDFYAPTTAAVAQILYLDFGIKVKFGTETGMFFNLMIIDPLTTRRTVSLAIALERGDF